MQLLNKKLKYINKNKHTKKKTAKKHEPTIKHIKKN